MATNIICCCAPIYKSILPEAGFWSRLGSRLKSYSSRSMLGKNTSKSTVNQTVGGSSQSTKTRAWLPLDLGGNASGFAWTGVRSENPRGSMPYANESSYAMKTVQIHQDIETV